MNDLSGQESMRGQIATKTTYTLEEIISSNKPNMLDISGTSLSGLNLILPVCRTPPTTGPTTPPNRWKMVAAKADWSNYN